MIRTGTAAVYAAAPEIVATYFGVEVPASPHLTGRMIAKLQQGSFEGAEVRTALATITAQDRVLEMGAGSGAVGAAIALNCRPAAMLSFEPNPRLVPHARALHAHNRLQDRITLRQGLVLADPAAPATVEFMLRGNFLGSGLTVPQGDTRAVPVQVAVTRYADLRRDWPHDVIVMDIEGAELDFLRHADLSGVRLVLMELHPGIYGEAGEGECRRLLRRAGFLRDKGLSGKRVVAFRRAA